MKQLIDELTEHNHPPGKSGHVIGLIKDPDAPCVYDLFKGTETQTTLHMIQIPFHCMEPFLGHEIPLVKVWLSEVKTVKQLIKILDVMIQDQIKNTYIVIDKLDDLTGLWYCLIRTLSGKFHQLSQLGNTIILTSRPKYSITFAGEKTDEVHMQPGSIEFLCDVIFHYRKSTIIALDPFNRDEISQSIHSIMECVNRRIK